MTLQTDLKLNWLQCMKLMHLKVSFTPLPMAKPKPPQLPRCIVRKRPVQPGPGKLTRTENATLAAFIVVGTGMPILVWQKLCDWFL